MHSKFYKSGCIINALHSLPQHCEDQALSVWLIVLCPGPSEVPSPM